MDTPKTEAVALALSLIAAAVDAAAVQERLKKLADAQKAHDEALAEAQRLHAEADRKLEDAHSLAVKAKAQADVNARDQDRLGKKEAELKELHRTVTERLQHANEAKAALDEKHAALDADRSKHELERAQWLKETTAKSEQLDASMREYKTKLDHLRSVVG